MFVTTIDSIPAPTETAAIMSNNQRESMVADSITEVCNATENNKPMTTAIRCPPITLRGVDATLFGTTKIINAVEATATTIAVLNTASSMRRMKMREMVAKLHWKI